MGLTDICAVVAIVISIMGPFFTRKQNNIIRFTDAFNQIYTKTFSLRSKVTKIIKEKSKDREDFYYEIDKIISNTYAEEYILDYLTEMENFFNLISWHSVTKQTLKKLVSFAFYQRILILYGYILYKRNTSKSTKMFSNYCKAVRKMKRIRKIKNAEKNKGLNCYVGIRESDIVYTKKFFKESICLFSSKPEEENFSVRMNQNIDNKEILPHYLSKITQLQTKSNYRFMFYNQATAYNYPEEILKNSVCVNDRELLTLLNNKLSLKKWLAERKIPIVPYETFQGKDILYSQLCSHFSGTDSFVIQRSRGGGGIGTYLATKNDFSSIIKQLLPLQQYIVSPYINSISANTHIFVSDKQTVLSPGSIQIIEKKKYQLCYCGCDFITFRDLSDEVRKKIKELSFYIADCLRKEGYHGIAGIDFIIDDQNQVYCTEINPRFQASTLLLDCYLKEKKLDKLEAKSSYELNEMAFSGSMITTLHYNDKINYSCYYYYNDNVNLQYYQEKHKLLCGAGVTVLEDGVDYYLNHGKVDENSYFFRAVFPHAICKISPDTTLWVNDNIVVAPKPSSALELKVALLNQGVRLEGDLSQIRKGVYESIDICIKANDYFEKDVLVNCAYQIHLSKYSPFKIVCKDQLSTLYYYDEEIAKVIPEKDLLQSFSEFDQKIVYIATDRLRIKLVSGCENKNMGRGCKFCNLPIAKHAFSLQEISDALEHLAVAQIPFRHILIGGGSSLSPDAWDKIIAICQSLKNNPFFKEKPISLMTMLPPVEVLPKLKSAGIEEVAFNLEISNSDLAKKLMPGKHGQGKEAYYDVLRAAVQVFGIGNVRSALLVGLDAEEDLCNEILTLADMGVLPCLSAFRALPDSDFEGGLGPSNEYLLNIYTKSVQLLEERQGDIRVLGPKCPACRNNMLLL